MEDQRREMLVLLDVAFGRLEISPSVRSWDYVLFLHIRTH